MGGRDARDAQLRLLRTRPRTAEGVEEAWRGVGRRGTGEGRKGGGRRFDRKRGTWKEKICRVIAVTIAAPAHTCPEQIAQPAAASTLATVHRRY